MRKSQWCGRKGEFRACFNVTRGILVTILKCSFYSLPLCINSIMRCILCSNEANLCSIELYLSFILALSHVDWSLLLLFPCHHSAPVLLDLNSNNPPKKIPCLSNRFERHQSVICVAIDYEFSNCTSLFQLSHPVDHDRICLPCYQLPITL